MFDALDNLHSARPSLGRGIAAGLAVAIAGGAVWAIVGRVTGWQIGYLAIGVGYAVGFAVAKVGRTTDTAGAATAAGLALAAALLGHLAWVYTAAAAELRVGVLDLLGALGPIEILTNTEITELFSWAFFMLASYAGFRAFAGTAAVTLADRRALYPPPVLESPAVPAGYYAAAQGWSAPPVATPLAPAAHVSRIAGDAQPGSWPPPPRT